MKYLWIGTLAVLSITSTASAAVTFCPSSPIGEITDFHITIDKPLRRDPSSIQVDWSGNRINGTSFPANPTRIDFNWAPKSFVFPRCLTLLGGARLMQPGTPMDPTKAMIIGATFTSNNVDLPSVPFIDPDGNGRDPFDQKNPWVSYKEVMIKLPIPEPLSWAMFIAGFGLTGVALRRQTAAKLATSI